MKSVAEESVMDALNHSLRARGPRVTATPERAAAVRAGTVPDPRVEREVGEQGDVGRLGCNREPCQQRGYGDDCLCHREMAPDAAAKAAGKWEVGVSRARLLGSRFKSRWIEPLRVGPRDPGAGGSPTG